LGRGDIVIKAPTEESYFMQQCCIAVEPYAFLPKRLSRPSVGGEYAECAGFPVIDDNCSKLRVNGGGVIWSVLGVYSCVPGSDVDSLHHEIAC
jgi:hypothetical protein